MTSFAVITEVPLIEPYHIALDEALLCAKTRLDNRSEYVYKTKYYNAFEY